MPADSRWQEYSLCERNEAAVHPLCTREDAPRALRGISLTCTRRESTVSLFLDRAWACMEPMARATCMVATALKPLVSENCEFAAASLHS